MQTTNTANTLTLPAFRINVSPVCLLAALKSIQDFVCEDETRFALTQVFFRRLESNTLLLCATDGVTLAEATVQGVVFMYIHNDAQSGTMRIETLTRLIGQTQLDAKTMQTATYALPDDGNGGFPDYTRLIPEKVEEGECARFIGVNPALLARCVSVQKALHQVDRNKFKNRPKWFQGRRMSPPMPPAMRMQVNGEHDPIRLDMSSGDASVAVVVLVMPCRL